jgi:hypothetical protein
MKLSNTLNAGSHSSIQAFTSRKNVGVFLSSPSSPLKCHRDLTHAHGSNALTRHTRLVTEAFLLLLRATSKLLTFTEFHSSCFPFR